MNNDEISLNEGNPDVRAVPDPQLDAIRGEGPRGIPRIVEDILDGPRRAGELSESGRSDLTAWTVTDCGVFIREGAVESTGEHTIKAFPADVRKTESSSENAYQGVLEGVIRTQVVIDSISESIDDGRLKKLTDPDIRLYAEKVCSRARAHEGTSSYIKIFAILVLTDHPGAIIEFVNNGLCDGDLPLITVPDDTGEPCELRRSQSPDVKLDCFENWTIVASPYFAKGSQRQVRFYTLSDRDILPWTKRYDRRRRGGYSKVSRARIHEKHHDYHNSPSSDGIFAVKKLRYIFTDSANSSKSTGRPSHHSDNGQMMGAGVKKAFQDEVEILRRFSEDAHPHLVSLLAAFQEGEDYCHLFHWAESDLSNLWKNTSPDEPLSDFGLARFHSENSRSNIRLSRVICTPTYRPPECDLEDSTISRSFDIWSLGCVLLEFVTWYLGGWEYLNKYVEGRMQKDVHGHKSDQLFELVEDRRTGEPAARVKLEIIEWVDELHTNAKCSEIMHQFLDYIQLKMLLVLPQDRTSCQEVYKKLDCLYQWLIQPSYKVIASPWTPQKSAEPDAFQVTLSEDMARKAKLRQSELRKHDGRTIPLAQQQRLEHNSTFPIDKSRVRLTQSIPQTL
ncbi:kinase-like domain-containing protein [Xylariales sp. AK1849]|nr:kinase-like domain-containing protein [Xylariales sp. AK1849]